MSNITIAAIVGSLQKDSINKKLYHAIKINSPEGVDIKFVDISKLPLFNQDDERGDLPEAVKIFKAEVEAADGVLYITPEHNRSFTAAIKNAIDWATRPYGNNNIDKKPSAVTGASGGPLGTFGAQNQLRQTVIFPGSYMMPGPELYFGNARDRFDEHGQVVDESSIEHIKTFINAFVDWIKVFKK